jgi:membrane protease YdiL (CAAX protease family)
MAAPYDLDVRRIDRRQLSRFLAIAVPSLGGATLAVAILEDGLGVPNPSAIYLVAVVATAIVSGTWGAVLASLASFLLYNFLFVEPRYTLTVAQPGELVNLLLLLFVGIVVGQLAALQRSRADLAVARELEARALFQVSRALATRASTPAVLPIIAGILRQETAMERIWVALGSHDARERVAADTEPNQRPALPGLHNVLQKDTGTFGEPARNKLAAAPEIFKLAELLFARPHEDLPLSMLGRLLWIRAGLLTALGASYAPGVRFGFVPSQAAWRVGALGFLAGFVPLSLVATQTGFVAFTGPRVEAGRLLLTSAGNFLGIYLVVALSEEMFFRAMLQQWFRHGGLVLASLMFGAAHLGYREFPNYPFAATAAAAGLLYGLVYSRGGLHAAMVCHALTVTFWRALFR